MHSKKLNKKSKNQLEEMVMVDKQGIKGLSKERRKKLEAYQHLFYLLQVSLRVKINMTKLLKEKKCIACSILAMSVAVMKRFPQECCT